MIKHKDETIISEKLNKLRSMRLHQPSGPIYKLIEKAHVELNLKNGNELEAICSLIESHAPSFRIRATYRYDQVIKSESEVTILNRKHIAFNCVERVENTIKDVVEKVAEMPKEWTIVQVTTGFNGRDSMSSNDVITSLNVSVFNCGQRKVPPFYITIDVRKEVLGNVIELREEMQSIIEENKNLLKRHFGNLPLEKISEKVKNNYIQHRTLLNSRLENVEKEIEYLWLKEWKCLFIGKFVDDKLEENIRNKIKTILETEKTFKCSEKVFYILTKLVAGSHFLSSTEAKKITQYCIPNHKELRTKMLLMVKTESVNSSYKLAKRFPIILILDEQLDCFCWEMMKVLQSHPVSRMPSFHFTYALFKEYEDSIVDGYKQISCENGRYIVNPGLNLPKMEERLKQFFEYWLPDWEGIIGAQPTPDEFEKYLTAGDIFVYNGHGSGTQFLSAGKIQHLRVNSVVFLFGCGSVQMDSASPETEMTDTFSNYLIACSPCIIGMLWEITDFDTDVLSTEILSRWIPSNAKLHWSQIDKNLWYKGTLYPRGGSNKKQEQEPDLLRVISQARTAPSYRITKSAVVARGLPVKLR